MDGLLKGVLIALFVAAYVLASHFALILPEGKSIAAALALGVPTFVLLGFIFQMAKKWLGKEQKELNTGAVVIVCSLATLLVCLALWLIWPTVSNNSEVLYFIQHVGTNALLAWVFGRTLVNGATPLIVTFARIVHPNLPPDIESYARKVTWAWVLFFVVSCVISVALFTMASITAWSTFAVLLQWPLVAGFFVFEYALRLLLFRYFDHASLRQGFEAYKQSQNNR